MLKMTDCPLTQFGCSVIQMASPDEERENIKQTNCSVTFHYEKMGTNKVWRSWHPVAFLERSNVTTFLFGNRTICRRCSGWFVRVNECESLKSVCPGGETASGPEVPTPEKHPSQPTYRRRQPTHRNTEVTSETLWTSEKTALVCVSGFDSGLVKKTENLFHGSNPTHSTMTHNSKLYSIVPVHWLNPWKVISVYESTFFISWKIPTWCKMGGSLY